jgi:hypothetical protein
MVWLPDHSKPSYARFPHQEWIDDTAAFTKQPFVLGDPQWLSTLLSGVRCANGRGNPGSATRPLQDYTAQPGSPLSPSDA